MWVCGTALNHPKGQRKLSLHVMRLHYLKPCIRHDGFTHLDNSSGDVGSAGVFTNWNHTDMTHSLLLPDRIRSLLQAWSKPDWRFQCYSWMVSFALTVKYTKMKPSQTHPHPTAAVQQSCCLQMTYSQLRATVPPSVRTKALISAQSWMQTTTSEIQASLILPGNYPEKLCGTSNLDAAPSSPGSATSNSTAQPCPLHHPHSQNSSLLESYWSY